MNEPHCGHIVPRPDAKTNRCGGPSRCDLCQKEMIEQIGPARASWYLDAIKLAQFATPTEVMMWAIRTRETSVELARTSAALRLILEAFQGIQVFTPKITDAIAVAKGVLGDE